MLLHQTPQVHKDALIAGRISSGIHHIHILQIFNFYTLSLVLLLLLLIHLRFSIGFLSIMISNLLKICQLNSTTHTQVSPTELFILQRNQGKHFATFLNSKHILDTIMHNPTIILPRSTKKHMIIVRVHNITQHLILILPNMEINKALLPHFPRMFTL